MIGMCFQYDTDDIYSAYLQISSLSIYFGVAIYSDLSWFSQMLIHTESLVFFPGFFALSQISICIYICVCFHCFLFGRRVGNQKWYALHMYGLAGCSRQDVMQRAFQCQKWSSSNVPVGLIIVIWNKAWTNGLTTHQTIWCFLFLLGMIIFTCQALTALTALTWPAPLLKYWCFTLALVAFPAAWNSQIFDFKISWF